MIPPPNEIPRGAPRLADGRYALLARIGRGGMAGVYAAWDLEIEEWRAIKVLLPKHARDGGLRMRFEREGHTMKSLQHPNLVRVYGVGSGEKLPFLVMELINAGSLYRWTKTHGAMPARMATEAMIQLCAGVSAVHAAGVVHRDIKPRNVLVNWDGVLKLTDFGIAQLGGSQETRTGLAMGTLGFMSPEQLHDAKSVDLRADIYAIGATLWSQITGRKARDLFRMEEEPRLMDGIPAPILPVLQRCLAYERGDRYPSARALSDALADLLPALPEDPADAPPLPLPLGHPSVRSKPESMFSEILTTLNGEGDASELSQSGSESPAPAQRRDDSRTIDFERGPPSGEAPDPGVPLGPVSLVDQAALSSFSRPGLGSSERPLAERWNAEDAEMPSYMLGVDQPSDRRRPELITYREASDDGPGLSPAMIWARRILVAVVGVPVVSGVALVAMLTLVASVGAWRVRSAAADLLAARVVLSDRLAQEESLPRDVELLGATGFREAYRQWDQTASEPARSEAAIAFVDAVEREARVRIPLEDAGHTGILVRQRLDRLTPARTEVEQAEQSLQDAAASVPGRVAILLHLAPAPAAVDG
ncbi:MAG: serine/threonine-protein kinase [Myxococcota bacterium]